MKKKREVERTFEEWFKDLPQDLGERLGPLVADYKKGNITIHEFLVSVPSSITARLFSLVYDALRMLEDRIIDLENLIQVRQ